MKKWIFFTLTLLITFIVVITTALILIFKFFPSDIIYRIAKTTNIFSSESDFDSFFLLLLVISSVISYLISLFIFQKAENKNAQK